MRKAYSWKSQKPRTGRRKRLSLLENSRQSCESLEPRFLLAAGVLTYHNDNMRTGENLNETALTPANVNAQDFGKLGQLPVDGAVYAQPLYKANVAIPGKGTHNVLYVATENDSVYAFDADTMALLWHDSFINPAKGVTAVPSSDLKVFDVKPVIGITSTPVIDPATHALYVVDKVKTITGRIATYSQHLHALDLATGAEKFGGPVNIQASVRGTGAGSRRGHIAFQPLWEFQRTGLLLANGVVYIAWASQGDKGPYHGWIIGYNAANLKQVANLNLTPNGGAGGIWMSGGALAADASNNVYAVTGNGLFDGNRNGPDFGDSVLKLSSKRGLTVADSFTPSDQTALNALDLDLGSGAPLLLPDQPGPNPHLLVTAGKQGTIYVINRDNLGGFNTHGDQVVQELHGALLGSYDTPAYFNGTVYYVGTASRGQTSPGGGDVLKAFSINNGLLSATPTRGTTVFGYPGSTPSISANGTADGIVWTLDNSAYGFGGSAILRAFDATNVAHELYDSTRSGGRDIGPPAVRFTVPTVVNGKVYVGGVGVVTVYGALPHP